MIEIKQFEEIQVNWNVLESIEAAEKKMEELEIEGFEQIEQRNGLFKSQFIYMRIE